MSRRNKWPSYTTKLDWAIKADQHSAELAKNRPTHHKDDVYNAATLLALMDMSLDSVGEYSSNKDFLNGYSRGLRLVKIGELTPEMRMFKVGGMYAMESTGLDEELRDASDKSFIDGYEAGKKLMEIIILNNSHKMKR